MILWPVINIAFTKIYLFLKNKDQTIFKNFEVYQKSMPSMWTKMDIFFILIAVSFFTQLA